MTTIRSPLATVLVDKCTLFREGLARILTGSHFRVVQSLPSINDVAEHVGTDGQTTLFVIGLTGASDDATELRSIRQQFQTAHIVVLVEELEPQGLATALQCGVDGYLLKTMTCEALIKSLDLVMHDEFVIPTSGIALLRQLGSALITPQAAPDPMPTTPSAHTSSVFAARLLSPREAQILACIREGGSNKLIARRFDITEATVKVHVKAILRKLRAKNRTQAAIWANTYLGGGPSDRLPPGSPPTGR